jgi:outer membrane lipoprotein SlyB
VLGIAFGRAVARPNDCPSEDDVACALQRLGITGIVGIAGATLGTAVAGRLGGSDPSTIGAFLGAVAGAAAGIGLEHLITEQMGLTASFGGAGTVVLFSVTQGIFAAAGSRLGAALRR